MEAFTAGHRRMLSLSDGRSNNLNPAGGQATLASALARAQAQVSAGGACVLCEHRQFIGSILYSEKLVEWSKGLGHHHQI